MGSIKQEHDSTFSTKNPNPALYVTKSHEIYLGESPALMPTSDQCIVHMRCNGICGSDLHFWRTGQIGSLQVECDHVLGHEGAGVVVWAGSNVQHLKLGDRVAVEPGIPCEQCYECSTGQYNLCRVVEFSGVPPHAGSIRRYHTHSAKYLHKLPDSLTFTDGALLEPLSVVLHAYERSPIRLGESTVICGAGPIGLIALAVAKASGAFPLLITDVDPGRLAFAKTFIPECQTVQVDTTMQPDVMASLIVKQIIAAGGDLPRVVYECTGVQSSVVTATYIPRPAGEVMVIGVGKPIMHEIPFMHISMAEVDLKFINRYHHSWPSAIRLLMSGYINLRPLVTHRFPLEKAVEALTVSANRLIGAIKVHIEDDDDDDDDGDSGDVVVVG